MKEKRPVIFYLDNKPEVAHLSPREVLKGYSNRCVEAVLGTRESFVCYRNHYKLDCQAGRIFWKKESHTSITFKSGRIYGALTPDLLSIIIEAFNLDWVNHEWVRHMLKVDKRLWQMVISGKVTNPEDLAKRYSKMYFKGVYSYRTLKNYYSNVNSFAYMGSLWDFFYHTTNPNLFIERLIQISSKTVPFGADREEVNLLKDTLLYCKYDNTKMNPSWSVNRLHIEHQKQIEKDILESPNTFSDKPLAPAFVKDGLELVLSEKDCYIEGCMMQNCVHTCYWPKIARGEYLLARSTAGNKKIDLGMNVRNGDILYDQLHTTHNGTASPELTTMCLDWIADNHDRLLEVVETIKKNNESDMPLPF